MALVMVVKNTFVDIEEPLDSQAGRSRAQTLPCDFGSSLKEDFDEDCASTLGDISEVETMSCSSLPSVQPALTGQVWSLSQDAAGCREVQDALADETLSQEQKEALAGELHGHVLEAALCPYANFVVQKCIVELLPRATQFMVDEIPSEAVSSLAQSKFGCRVLQRLLERSASGRAERLVDAVLADLLSIAQSAFGNYVVQLLLDCPGVNAQQQLQLAQLLREKVGDLGTQDFGCIVLSAALAKFGAEDRQALVCAMLQEPCLLGQMACSRHGHKTVLAMLSLLAGDELEGAKAVLVSSNVAASKYGRAVVATLG